MTNEKIEIPKFEKSQLLLMNKFLTKRDLLTVLLDKNKKYSIEDAEKEIQKFLKG